MPLSLALGPEAVGAFSGHPARWQCNRRRLCPPQLLPRPVFSPIRTSTGTLSLFALERRRPLPCGLRCSSHDGRGSRPHSGAERTSSLVPGGQWKGHVLEEPPARARLGHAICIPVGARSHKRELYRQHRQLPILVEERSPPYHW